MYNIKVEGLTKAVKDIRVQGELAEERKNLFLMRIADAFRVSARVHFNSMPWQFRMDNPSPIVVGVEREGDGYAVYAQGEQVAFIEFGAGVYYNGAESYLLPRPSEVAGIGEFGQGKGKQNTWGYYSENGNLQLTHGNPPANAMYYAAEDVRRQLEAIAKEVFSK